VSDAARVDELVGSLLAGEDDALRAAESGARDAGLPAIGVSAPQGKLLALLARAIGARRILELGTLGGYSAIWMARALPADGRLVTIELRPEYADVAGRALERAGVRDRVEILVGPALDVLAGSPAAIRTPFDLAFLDADKATMPEQVMAVIPLVRSGGLLVCDNVVRGGAVAAAEPPDPSVAGVRRALEVLAEDPRVDATVIQTVGAKGHDGFALAVVR
jgi:predicted O-methyltransferase YrrM